MSEERSYFGYWALIVLCLSVLSHSDAHCVTHAMMGSSMNSFKFSNFLFRHSYSLRACPFFFLSLSSFFCGTPEDTKDYSERHSPASHLFPTTQPIPSSILTHIHPSGLVIVSSFLSTLPSLAAFTISLFSISYHIHITNTHNVIHPSSSTCSLSAQHACPVGTICCSSLRRLTRCFCLPHLGQASAGFYPDCDHSLLW